MELQSDKELREAIERYTAERSEQIKALTALHLKAPVYGYRELAKHINKKIKEFNKLIGWLTELQERRAK